MKTMMLLLVSTVALLVSPAIAKPHHNPHHPKFTSINLDRVFDLATNYSTSLPQNVRDSYLDRAKDEGPNPCKHEFFCKVEKILANSTHFGGQQEMVRNLVVYNKGHKAICDQVTQREEVLIQLSDFLDHLISCIQRQNFHGKSNNS